MAFPEQDQDASVTRGQSHAPEGMRDLQSMLEDTFEDIKFQENRQLLVSRAVGLMQAKAALLSSAAKESLHNAEREHSEQFRRLQLGIADRECQLVSARADTDQWKRRASILFLKVSSAQEDVDMYSMRCQLLEAQILRESSQAKACQSQVTATEGKLAICQDQLQASQQDVGALQAKLGEAQQSVEELRGQVSCRTAELERGRQTAAAAASAAAKELAGAQAEHEAVRAQAAAASRAAEAAEKRCEELQWRLQQQDAALAQRARLAEEARAATEGLSKDGLQAVREKALFLEGELRGQLADARGALEVERAQRRAAEAALAQQLRQTRSEAAALQAGRAFAREAQEQQQAREALEVVSSLVQDLAPPDSVVRPTKPAGAASNSSCDVQQQNSTGKAAAAAGAAAGEPGATAKAPAGKAAKGGAASKQRDSKALAASEADRAPAEAKARGKPCKPDAESEHNAELKHAAKRKAKAAKDAFNTELVPADAKLRGAASKKSKAAEETHEAAQMPVNAKQDRAGKEAKAAKEKGKAACQEDQRAPPEVRMAADARDKGAAKAATSRAVEAAIDAKMEPPPTAAGAAADRPHRKRASKQPYWLAQAVSPAADTEPSDVELQASATTGKHAAQDEDPDGSEYEPSGAKKRGRRKLAEGSAPHEQEAEPSLAEAEAEDTQKPKGRKRSKLAEVKPAVDTEDSPAGAAERAVKHAQRTAAAQDDSSVGLAQRATGDHAAVDPAPDNEKAFRRLRRASRENYSASSAAEAQQAAEAAAAMTDGEAAVRAISGSSEEAQQEPAASALQIVSGPAAAAADGNKDTAAAEEARAPAAGAERRPQQGKGQPKAAAQEAAGADHPAVKSGQEAGAAGQVARWEKARPAGVSKIDLTNVWGQEPTPLATAGHDGAAGKDKENPLQAVPKAPSLTGIIKPLPGRSRFNTGLEANPLAALNPRVLEAAGALRPGFVSGLAAPSRPAAGGPAPAGKRRLLPAPKPLPTGAVSALSQDVLFGQGFKVPRLGRQ
ncbi:hypothetical protein CVIRNUC_007800 [Coccomyxa viridis]|uniref:Uncharacterized protein n=1 Tax=Coccomyxa viridis TaxID=1274662 RepID=A0AAV1ICZ2_9CHLO|nr:hypothetical protein CVIRNUC_007800 [Coccomyxa viridis]